MKPIYWHDTRLDTGRVDEYFAELADMISDLRRLESVVVNNILDKYDADIYIDDFQDAVRVTVGEK